MPSMRPETLLLWGERASEARGLIRRLRKHMTITQLAARLGTREKVVYRWASGQVSPRQATLRKLRTLGSSGAAYKRAARG